VRADTFTTTSHFDKHRVGPYKERVGREGQCRRCLTYMKWSNTIFMPHVAGSMLLGSRRQRSDGFTSHFAEVTGVRLHYLIGWQEQPGGPRDRSRPLVNAHEKLSVGSPGTREWPTDCFWVQAIPLKCAATARPMPAMVASIPQALGFAALILGGEEREGVGSSASPRACPAVWCALPCSSCHHG
jgi:hypothetical protein